MPFSRARGKLGVDILKFQVWYVIDFWPLFVCRRSYRWHICMFVQGQHIDTDIFVIWHSFQFDLSLTFEPLSIGWTKRSPWTLMHVCPTPTHWLFYDTFCNLTLSVGRTKRSPWTLLHLCPRLTHWPFLLLSFDTFFNLTFLWPLTP